MKKILTLFLSVLALQFTIAQTVLYQNFTGTTWPPAGWTVLNQAGNWSRVQSNTAGGTVPEARLSWTPQFNGVTRFISPALDLTGNTKVMVKFRHSVDHYSSTYQIGLATRSGGALGVWTNIWSPTISAAIPAEQKIFVIENNDVNKPDFQIGFFFSGDSYNLNYWYIDDVEISLVPNLDAALASITVPDMFAGAQSVGGLVSNLGSTTITSMNVNWQLNSGIINTTSFNGLNLATAASYNFSCTQQINVDPGTYQLKVWVSNVNGTTGDDVPQNDTITKTISVVDQTSLRKPLFEEFTSSTCPPCATFNNGVMNPFFNQFGQTFTLIKYQMNWPGSGDPYYTAEGGVRRTYYGVNAVPHMIIEGATVATNMGAVTAAYNAALNTPAFMLINSQHLIEGYNITVNATVTSQVSIANAVVHIVVIENLTTGNVGSNGETSFKHVMMKMLPNASGTVVNLVAGEPASLSYSHNMSTTFVEEMNDLSVVVFVQNNANKSIYQSAYSTQVTSFITPGDANCDDNVNVLDVVTMVSYILGNNPTPFCFDNADVNGDGSINVIDVVGTVNIITGGKKHANIPIKSRPAQLMLSHQGITLESDGTLAGLQFELSGVQPHEIIFLPAGYEFELVQHDGLLKGIIFSFDNTPLPSGNIQLFRFIREIEDASWGNAYAANVNANEVKVTRLQHNQLAESEIQCNIQTYPNPSSGVVSIQVALNQSSDISIKLTDVLGKEVSAVYNGQLSEGIHTFTMNKERDIPAGVYFLRTNISSEGSEKQIVSKAIKVMIAY